MKVTHGQTLFDIAIQACGDVSAAYAIAELNGLSVTDDLMAGDDLDIVDVVNADVVSYYKNKGLYPATSLVPQAELIQSVVDTFIIIAPVQLINVAIVIDGQNLIDIATQYCGSADAAYDIAQLNELSLTADLAPGLELKLPSVVNKKIADYYKTKGIKPATSTSISGGTGGGGGTTTGDEGIGYWAIEVDFIVS